jgi:ribosomal protein S18 acetylase RimI-like enzyme
MSSISSNAAGQKRKADRKSKQKLKKERRRQEKLERAARLLNVRKAMYSSDDETPLNFLVATGFNPDSPFCNYTKNNLSVQIEYGDFTTLSKADFETIYELTRGNMVDQYNRAAEKDPTWSWSEKKKKSELMHSDARYLLVRESSSNDIVGFAHIRFEAEEDVEVTYLYELQLTEAVQNHGLGKRIMQIIELVSAKLHMKWVMLTVFKANQAAWDFYQKLKYEIDETDPSLCEETATDEPAPYNIL